MTATITRTYTVEGMSCDRCRASVDQHISQAEGVENVAIDLTSGLVEVSGSGFDDDAVKGAVEAAGYQLSEAR